MKRLLFNFLFFLLAFGTTHAQTQRKCGSHENLLAQLAREAGFLEKRLQIEQFTRDYVRKGGSGQSAQRGTPVYTIPVVVHVVYKTAAQNISDAQIQSQLDVINRDFQMNNTDVGSVPSAFTPLVADCKIQFCLAQRDPGGAATTGIVRKQTTVTSFSTNDNVKKNSAGGDNAWDATKYLNLWVCNISGGILGYAQFPGGPVATDGVVINYTAFGTTGTATAPFNLGRTATHEVGHWLNLYHIWGDDGSACSGSDEVGDTPNQADENYGCPSFPAVSCGNGPNGDMFMNYMDYTDDRCMFMFTVGQRDRMYAVLQPGGARASLASSLGCSPPTTTGCAVPGGLTVSSITSGAATISWAGVSGATSYTLRYKTAAASTYTTVSVAGTSYTITGLSAGTAYNYQVGAICGSTTGSFSAVQTFTTSGAGCSDAYEPNNTLAAGVTIPSNGNINALISSSTDKDYFKFTNTSTTRNIKVVLSNLTADYDVKLYSPTGALVRTSENGGTTTETITYNTSTTGTYKIYVYGYNGANSTTCYNLAVQTGSSTFRDDERSLNNKTFVKISPVPASGVVNVAINATETASADIIVTNQLGGVVLRSKTTVYEGANNTRINTERLSNGVYFLKVQQGAATYTTKLVVQH